MLANLSRSLQLSGGGRLLLDIGHRSTNVCLLVNGSPAALRSLPIAGADFTEALSSDLEISSEAAEEYKHERGIFDAGDLSPVSEGVEKLLDRLVRETRRSIEAVSGDRLHGIAPEAITLVGGSAPMAGLASYLGDRLGLPCSELRVPAADAALRSLSEVGAAQFGQATALALRGAPSARVTGMNFRQDEFAYTLDLGDLRRSVGVTVGLVALLLLLWVANLSARLFAQEGRAETLRSQIASIYEATFAEPPPAGDDPFAALEARVRETRELSDHLGVTGNGLSALEVLREISARTPPGLDVALTDLAIERYSIQARGYARDFESVDRIRAELVKYAWFEDVRLTNVVTDPRRGGKSFSLTIRLKDGT